MMDDLMAIKSKAEILSGIIENQAGGIQRQYNEIDTSMTEDEYDFHFKYYDPGEVCVRVFTADAKGIIASADLNHEVIQKEDGVHIIVKHEDIPDSTFSIELGFHRDKLDLEWGCRERT